MEQQKAKSKILKFLPRASSSVSFQNPPLYSPNKDKRSSEKTHKSNLGIGFSGPMVSIVPSDTRRKIKNVNDSTYTLVYEPTSPRVSCMGQVKCKHYRNNKLAGAGGVTTTNKPPEKEKPKNKVSKTMSFTISRNQEKMEKVDQDVVVKSKKKNIGIRSIFRGGRKSDATNNNSNNKNNNSKTVCNLPRAPSMSTMKRFSSGRDAFKNFDWTTQVAPLNSDHRNYFTDGEGDGEGDEEVLIMPSSAPVIVRNKGICDEFVRGGGVINLEPRKEINLWKRRTMPQPPPLQLHVA